MKARRGLTMEEASIIETGEDKLEEGGTAATNARRPGNEASARTDNCVLRAPDQSPLYVCPPSFFNLWIRPCPTSVFTLQLQAKCENDV